MENNYSWGDSSDQEQVSLSVNVVLINERTTSLFQLSN
jgi:hypothetical protein